MMLCVFIKLLYEFKMVLMYLNVDFWYFKLLSTVCLKASRLMTRTSFVAMVVCLSSFGKILERRGVMSVFL